MSVIKADETAPHHYDPLASMAVKQARNAGRYGEKDLFVMYFLMFTPIIGIVGTAAYTWYRGFSLWMPIFALLMYLAVGISICAGYHRFFSHKSYDASAPVQLFFAIFGAMAAQNSILWWSSSHRVHHKHVDQDWDPYNIQRGFWWAHILWVFYRHPAPDAGANAVDLLKNPIVVWQDRWYKHILIFGGFGLPLAVGAMFGDPIAGLLWGGFLRLAVIHHTTFFVNSLAHYVGRPTYNAAVSARDNWAVALLTLGEGYHSFHHRFPADFRNGIRWYHWDPAKWFIGALKMTGLASNLRATPPPQVEQARMYSAIHDVEHRLSALRGDAAERVHKLIDDARNHLDTSRALWRQHVEETADSASRAWRGTRRKALQHMRESQRCWKSARQLMDRGMINQS